MMEKESVASGPTYRSSTASNAPDAAAMAAESALATVR